MQVIDDTIIRSTCSWLMVKAFRCLDVHDVDGFVALFSDDATFERPGLSVQGAAALRDFAEGRSRERVTRHVLAPPVIDVEGDASAKGVGVFVLYEAMATDQAEPLPLQSPLAVGEFQQTYRRTAEGWRIASSTVLPIFRRAS